VNFEEKETFSSKSPKALYLWVREGHESTKREGIERC
jgi:hypothetical protein